MNRHRCEGRSRGSENTCHTIPPKPRSQAAHVFQKHILRVGVLIGFGKIMGKGCTTQSSTISTIDLNARCLYLIRLVEYDGLPEGVVICRNTFTSYLVLP